MDLYSKVVLPSLVNLIIKYGISLEAHLQNAIVIFENGTPVKLMIRDNGGIRIHKGILGEWTEILKINNATNLLTDSSIDLYQMFSHAVLHNHLGEIIVKLTKEFGINESLLWDKVGEVIQETLNSLRKQERYKQVADFEDYIFGKNSYLKALLTMRLSDSIVDNMYVMANNPLQFRVKGEIK
jgi:siderophore synthetase component